MSRFKQIASKISTFPANIDLALWYELVPFFIFITFIQFGGWPVALAQDSVKAQWNGC